MEFCVQQHQHEEQQQEQQQEQQAEQLYRSPGLLELAHRQQPPGGLREQLAAPRARYLLLYPCLEIVKYFSCGR